MLTRGKNVAETALQWIGLEERAASGCLKSSCDHSLRDLRDVRRGRSRLGLSRRRRGSYRFGISVKLRQKLQCERADRCKFYLCLAERKLKVRMGLQRRRRKATTFLYRLRCDFVKARRAIPKATPLWMGVSRAGTPSLSAAPPANRLAGDHVDHREAHLLWNEYVLDTEVATTGAS